MTTAQKITRIRQQCAELTAQIRAIEANPAPPPSPPGHHFRQAIRDGLARVEAEDLLSETAPG